MIRVAAHVDDDEPPPEMLSLAWQCKDWQTLPDAGGLFDQSLSVMTEMQTALSTYNAFKVRKNMDQHPVKFVNEHHDLYVFTYQIDKLRGKY